MQVTWSDAGVFIVVCPKFLLEWPTGAMFVILDNKVVY